MVQGALIVLIALGVIAASFATLHVVYTRRRNTRMKRIVQAYIRAHIHNQGAQ